jgi:hypothetical protein
MAHPELNVCRRQLPDKAGRTKYTEYADVVLQLVG